MRGNWSDPNRAHAAFTVRCKWRFIISCNNVIALEDQLKLMKIYFNSFYSQRTDCYYFSSIVLNFRHSCHILDSAATTADISQVALWQARRLTSAMILMLMIAFIQQWLLESLCLYTNSSKAISSQVTLCAAMDVYTLPRIILGQLIRQITRLQMYNFSAIALVYVLLRAHEDGRGLTSKRLV